jgi:uncharacterized protein YndB with AHSA1/START domain
MTELVVRRVIPIRRERVFDAWLDPVRLARFMCPTTAKRATAEVDPRVGGRFRIVMFHPDVDADGVAHTGEYLLIDRPSRLSFTWESHFTDGLTTVVTIDFIERGKDTEVVLTHDRLPPQAIEAHRRGWTDILQLLGELSLSS